MIGITIVAMAVAGPMTNVFEILFKLYGTDSWTIEPIVLIEYGGLMRRCFLNPWYQAAGAQIQFSIGPKVSSNYFV